MLNWKSSVEVQQKGIELARNIKELSLLIMPPAPPSVWEVCANILSEKSNDVLLPYIDSLLEWLYDLNWPGALTILGRLNNFPIDLLKNHIETTVIKITDMNNPEDSGWLYSLSKFLNNKKLKKLLSKRTLEILEQNYL